MKNLVEFVTQKGGGVLFVAGENFNPLALQGDAAGAAPADRAGRRPEPDGRRRGRSPAFRPDADRRGARRTRSSGSATTRSPARRIWDDLPELNWYFEAPRKKPAAFVLAEHPTLSGRRRRRCRSSSTSSSASGKSMFNAVDDTWRWRFRVGDNATSAGSGSRRSGSSPGRSCSARSRPRSTTDRRRYHAEPADRRSRSGSPTRRSPPTRAR